MLTFGLTAEGRLRLGNVLMIIQTFHFHSRDVAIESKLSRLCHSYKKKFQKVWHFTRLALPLHPKIYR